jgi:hypothetical protein
MINDFRGNYMCLSNFISAWVPFDGIMYPSVEHAFQAAKTLDPEERNKIRLCRSAGDAKRAGRLVTMRSDWLEVRVEIMYELVKQKFERNPLMLQTLLDTGDKELVEGNTWHDNFWGACLCSKCDGLPKQNQLGKILMRVRTELRTIPR